VVQAILQNGVLPRGGHVVLPDDLFEGLGTILSGKDLVGHKKGGQVISLHSWKPLPLLPSGPGGICGPGLREDPATDGDRTDRTTKARNKSGAEMVVAPLRNKKEALVGPLFLGNFMDVFSF